MSSSPVSYPLPVPNATKAAPPAELSEKEQGLYNKVYEHFTQESYLLPDSEDGTLKEQEKMWLSYECLLRYLRAVKWNSAEEAIQRLETTLKWRRDYGLYDTITPDSVQPEALTGKEFLFGFDTHGRPAQYMLPSRQNTEESPRQMQFTVWYIERTIDLMGPGVETLALMIDYADKAKNPSLATARTFLAIFQTHYPERLGLALILNVPWLLNAFYKLVTPFIDPVTRTKMRFNPVATADGLIFELDQLAKSWGGEHEFEYKHEEYWPKLVEMCEARRAALFEIWKGMGGTIGLREYDMKMKLASQKDEPADAALAQASEAVEA
ncbi:CRAL TRIO domain-containing protein [Coniophora puteana RWD-64-598 SS2]|uniref:CRAL TRIO domain-containing protein n=1 Tax=Coniophora puteana (strain RWD-64-598) TaxID=741705 RepID=A0A5M3MXQ8_CONPW|nr:CRAL TRIO domain-containing protein [Coniophora puteana RWD-64-598 SS2]EIW83953.1 CRAL TRIO domain-containing protein [Coniophora puteana RWD-64-598 SS2]